jgi:hypothetical protein
MNQSNVHQSDCLQHVFEYHQATKHQFQAYASGPGYLDWVNQPDPFRRYAGARLIPLHTIEPTDEPRYDDIFISERMPAPGAVNGQTISQLFYHSLALSAWKSTGETRWALRVNASSGNLHPTEGHLICGPVKGLCDQPWFAIMRREYMVLKCWRSSIPNYGTHCVARFPSIRFSSD